MTPGFRRLVDEPLDNPDEIGIVPGVSTPFTPEQTAAIEAAQSGSNLVISAFAGTGKTTTLRGIAEAQADDRILYLAFNKAIQEDAADSFPANVECRTAHSMAYGWMRQNRPTWMNRLRGQRVASWTAAKALGIPFNGFNSGEVSISQRGCAGIALATVERFCRSNDAEIGERHVPREIEDHNAQADLRAFIAPFAAKAWRDLTADHGTLKPSHGIYLKLYAMSEPDLSARYDVILFDEAQDANPCIAQIVLAQVNRAQVIMVGDANQAIYGWNGAVDAMSDFAKHPGVVNLAITQSFRFGPAVADVANVFLSILGTEGRVRGFYKVESRVEPIEDADVILCRTNAGALQHALEAQAQGRKVALVGGTKDIARFVKAVDTLKSGRKPEHEDLVAFDTWADVVAYAKSDEGRDLRVMVNLIEAYGTVTILGVCDAATENEDDADLIVSTAHKSKGREWDRVKIATDFRQPEGDSPRRDEMMLLYVACTRAKLTLDWTSVSWAEGFVPQEAGA